MHLLFVFCLGVGVSASGAQSAPEHVHLALTGSASSIRVSFKSNSSLPAVCVYGLSPARMNLSSTENTPPASYLPAAGYHHVVLLSSLLPTTTYSYSCDGSAMRVFSTAQETPTKFRAAVFGDWGYLGTAQRGAELPFSGLASNWSAVPTWSLLQGLKNELDLVYHVGFVTLYTRTPSLRLADADPIPLSHHHCDPSFCAAI